MCLASTPPAGGSKTILGSESAIGSGFDSAADGFSGRNANDQGFSGPDLSTSQHHRRGTLLTPSPSPTPPDFGELDTTPGPFAQKSLSNAALGGSGPRELDITPAPGVLSSAVPAFAPPYTLDAAPAPKLPKPALARLGRDSPENNFATRGAPSTRLTAKTRIPAFATWCSIWSRARISNGGRGRYPTSSRTVA